MRGGEERTVHGGGEGEDGRMAEGRRGRCMEEGRRGWVHGGGEEGMGMYVHDVLQGAE